MVFLEDLLDGVRLEWGVHWCSPKDIHPNSGPKFGPPDCQQAGRVKNVVGNKLNYYDGLGDASNPTAA